MAKSQVTEDDIAQGIQSLGGFGGLSGQKPRRDSPFGSDFAVKKQEAKSFPPSVQPEVIARPVAAPELVAPTQPLVKKFEAVSPSKEEIAANPRARSSKMRIAVKI